jgi:hypothetical protein
LYINFGLLDGGGGGRERAGPRPAGPREQVKRRTNVVAVFPNEDAIVRLVGALMLEQYDEWRKHCDIVRLHASLGYEPLAPEVFVPGLTARPSPCDGSALPAVLLLAPRPRLNERSTRITRWGLVMHVWPLSSAGIGKRMVIEGARSGAPDDALIKLVVNAVALRDKLLAGGGISIDELSARGKLTGSYATRLLRLTFLAPDLVRDILDGRHPPTLTANTLMADTRLPLAWSKQRLRLQRSGD